MIETTAAGAAFMAGLGAGIWKSYSDIKKVWSEDKKFSPVMKQDDRDLRMKKWSLAVKQARVH
jgi:glycerol kinase